MVDEQLRAIGVGRVHRLDLIAQAATAARRDRPAALRVALWHR